MPDPQTIADETLDQLLEHLPSLRSSSRSERQLAREIIYRGIVRQVLRDIWQVWNYEGAEPREALLDLVDPAVIQTDFQGQPLTCNIDTPHWREWYPGLDNADWTLGSVLDKLPGFAPEDVPPLVRVFENPSSPIALTGACTLEQHDAIHILLGRGLVDQDEAFTIGFTAGTSKADLSEDEKNTYRIALTSYDEPYRIRGRDLLAFDLGVKAGTFCPCSEIHTIDVPRLRDRRLGEIRQELGIDVKILRDFYQLERLILPGTPASIRLPV